MYKSTKGNILQLNIIYSGHFPAMADGEDGGRMFQIVLETAGWSCSSLHSMAFSDFFNDGLVLCQDMLTKVSKILDQIFFGRKKIVDPLYLSDYSMPFSTLYLYGLFTIYVPMK